MSAQPAAESAAPGGRVSGLTLTAQSAAWSVFRSPRRLPFSQVPRFGLELKIRLNLLPFPDVWLLQTHREALGASVPACIG